MVDLQWRYTIPSEGSKVGIGASDIRHQKRQIEKALNVSFNVGDEDNAVKAGAALPIYQAASKNSYGPSGPATDHWYLGGQLFIESDTSRVYSFHTLEYTGVNVSNTTLLLGTPNHIEHGNTDYARATWVERSDSYQAATAGEHTIDFNIAREDPTGTSTGILQGFDGIPTVIASGHTSGNNSLDTAQVQVVTVYPDKFTIYVQSAEVEVHWTSIGTVSGEVGGVT